MSDNGFHVIGKPVQRSDARGHVTGRTQFFEDVNPTGMLHLKMHRSDRHHALITDVDTSEAEATQSTRVLPNSIRTEPAGWSSQSRVILIGLRDTF